MADRQLKLYAQTTAGGTKTTTTTISNVNSQVDSATMKSFAQKLNAFTTNTYQKTDLVETTNVDTETVAINTTVTITETTVQIADGRAYIPFEIQPNISSKNPFGVAYRSDSGAITYYPLKPDLKRLYLETNTPGTYTVMIAIHSPDPSYTSCTTTGDITVTAAS